MTTPPPEQELPMAHLCDTWVGELAAGCKACQEGTKMVLFITGMCEKRCFYCPISELKWLRDVIYANERYIGTGEPGEAELEAILEEAQAMEAGGTGITGGDPMDKPQRVLRVIKALKERFGASHHIHMYSSGNFDPAFLPQLMEAGLDEIRFHPMVHTWAKMEGSEVAEMLKAAREAGLTTGVEVPAVPGKEAELQELITFLEEAGVEFCNLNELEISDTNIEDMEKAGVAEPRDDSSVGAKASEELALKLIEEFQGDLPLHYCSAGFKDGVQLRGRLKRRAERNAAPYEELTEDGTVLKGIIEIPEWSIENDADKSAVDKIIELILLEHDLDPDLLGVNKQLRRLELPAKTLRALAPELNLNCFIVEELPTAEPIEVEREPL